MWKICLYERSFITVSRDIKMLEHLEKNIMVVDLKINLHKNTIHFNFICIFNKTPKQI